MRSQYSLSLGSLSPIVSWLGILLSITPGVPQPGEPLQRLNSGSLPEFVVAINCFVKAASQYYYFFLNTLMPYWYLCHHFPEPFGEPVA